MKKLIVILSLFVSILVFAQQSPTAKSLLVLPPLQTLKTNTFSFHNNSNNFSVYHPVFKTYYNYSPAKDTLRVTSITYTYNSTYNVPGTRTDSFNPTNASNLGSALVLGLINTLFKKD